MSSAGASNVMREYLISLGFRVDATGAGNTDRTLARLDRSAVGLGLSLGGVIAATQALVQNFAAGMEQMYYSSRRIGTTVVNLKAMEAGAARVGLTTDQMKGALESMAQRLRTQPGLTEYLEGLGVKVTGRDASDVLKDMVGSLKQMPYSVSAQVATMFGMDEGTLFQPTHYWEEFIAAEKDQRDTLARLGLDYQKAAEAGKDYANMLRDIKTAAQNLTDSLAVRMLPLMQQWQQGLAGGINSIAESINKPDLFRAAMREAGADIKDNFGTWRGIKGNFGKSTVGKLFGAAPGKEARTLQSDLGAPGSGGGETFTGLPKGDASGPGQLFPYLERKFGLPPGMLDRVWNAESSRGKYMLSPAGAQGHFGLMPGTQKDLGVTDPNNLVDSAYGAAKYLSQLRGRYGGDDQKALAAYNWGMGNLDKYGLGAAPDETRGYLAKNGMPLTGGVQQSNYFNITGSDPQATAKAVGQQIDRANGELIRNFKGAIQ